METATPIGGGRNEKSMDEEKSGYEHVFECRQCLDGCDPRPCERGHEAVNQDCDDIIDGRAQETAAAALLITILPGLAELIQPNPVTISP
jgi:hypothetical protein